MLNIKKIREAIFGAMDTSQETLASITTERDTLRTERDGLLARYDDLMALKKQADERATKAEAAAKPMADEIADLRRRIAIKDNELAAARGNASQAEQLIRAIAERQGINVAELLGEDEAAPTPAPTPADDAGDDDGDEADQPIQQDDGSGDEVAHCR